MMKLRNIFVCGWCIALVVACGQSYETKQRMTRAERAKLKTADSLALKVGVMPTLDCMPLFVAKERRLFDTLGVDVRLRMRKAQMDIDTALIGGSVEGAVSDSVRVARMRSRGTALTEVGTTNTSWQLVGNRSARLKEVKQLGDKMVAMTRYSATDFLTDHVLKGVKTTATVYRTRWMPFGCPSHKPRPLASMGTRCFGIRRSTTCGWGAWCSATKRLATRV